MRILALLVSVVVVAAAGAATREHQLLSVWSGYENVVFVAEYPTHTRADGVRVPYKAFGELLSYLFDLPAYVPAELGHPGASSRVSLAKQLLRESSSTGWVTGVRPTAAAGAAAALVETNILSVPCEFDSATRALLRNCSATLQVRAVESWDKHAPAPAVEFDGTRNALVFALIPTNDAAAALLAPREQDRTDPNFVEMTVDPKVLWMLQEKTGRPLLPPPFGVLKPMHAALYGVTSQQAGSQN